MPDLRRVFLRNTLPSYLTFGLVGVALGLNFWLTTPTFNPYYIDRHVIGAAFFVLGAAKLTLTLIGKRSTLLRFALAADIAFMVFWAFGGVITGVQGLTSYQLPIVYCGLVALESMLLVESLPTQAESAAEEAAEPA